MFDLATLIPRASSSALTGPTSGFVEVFGGRKTNSGERVTPQRALTLSAYYACIRVIAEDVAKLPLDILRWKDDAGTGRVWLRKDPVALLMRGPNPEMTGYVFRETLTQWACGWGNGYAEIVRDGTGRVRRLWPIHPSRVRHIRRDGRPYLQVTNDPDEANNGRQTFAEFPASDIFHLRGMGTASIGYSIAQFGAESIGLGLAAEGFGAAFFGQGSTSSGILTHPGTLGEAARANLRESWQKTYGGTKNSHKVAILEEGVKWEQITIPPEQAQFLETRQFQVEEICRWARVAPHKIQHLLHATFSNIEHQGREHVTDTLLPWLTRWTTEIDRQIIVDDGDRFADFDEDVLTRGDTNARTNYFRTMVNIGAMSPDEVREREGINPTGTAAGRQYYMQTNMATLETVAAGVKPAAPAGRPATVEEDEEMEAAERRAQFDAQRDALHGAFLSEADRVLTKEAKAVANAIKKPDLEPFAATFYASQSGYLVAAMSPLCSALCDIAANVLGVSRQSIDLDTFAAEYCEAARAHLVATKSIPDHHTPAALADAVVALVCEKYP